MKARAITLLSLLRSNNRWGNHETDRTTVIKQAFLAENLKPLYDVWFQTFSFVRYNYGPFADDVFQQLDTLIFNGLVEVTRYRRSSGRIEARYVITEFGTHHVNQFAPSEISALTDDLVWALQSIGITKATWLCKLVYQEPEFVTVLENDAGRGVGPEHRTPLPAVLDATNMTFQYLTSIKGLDRLRRRENGDTSLSPRELVRVYLELLAARIAPQK